MRGDLQLLPINLDVMSCN